MEETNRENMATLLENQAAQLLRETNTMSSGEVGGFTNIAFPIVRRVFGGLIANELVSIQPMSLPSGLLFYLDYTYGSTNGPYAQRESIYGGPAGAEIQKGANAAGGQYDLAGVGYSRKHASVDVLQANITLGAEFSAANADHLKLVGFDPQLLELAASGEKFQFVFVKKAALVGADDTLVRDIAVLSSLSGVVRGADVDNEAVVTSEGVSTLTANVDTAVQSGTSQNVRRLSQIGTGTSEAEFVPDAIGGEDVVLVVKVPAEIPGLTDRVGAENDD
jgi:hypothetical protein